MPPPAEGTGGPAPPADPHTLAGGAARVLVVLVVAVFGASAAWLRLPGRDRGVVWAEDGLLFLQQWLNTAGLSVLAPYDGYLHVVPRLLVALAASWVGPAAFAQTVTACCCVVVGLLTAVVWVCSADVVDSIWVRLTLTMVTPLAPPAGAEVLGNVANLHWYFLWAALFLVLHRPRSWTGGVVLGVLAALASLTEIQAVVWIPLVPVVLSRRGDGRRRGPQVVVHTMLVAGLVVQGVVTVAQPRPPRGDGAVSPLSLLEGFLAGPVLTAVTGRAPVQGQVVDAVGWWPSVILLALVVATAVVAVRRGSPHRVVGPACLLAAVAVFGASLVVNNGPGFDYRSYSSLDWAGFVPPRYVVVPAMLLLATVLVGADALAGSRRRSARVVGALAVVGVATALVVNVRPSFTGRTGQEVWSTEVHRAQNRCERGRDPVRVAVAPGEASVVISCERLQWWARDARWWSTSGGGEGGREQDGQARGPEGRQQDASRPAP